MHFNENDISVGSLMIVCLTGCLSWCILLLSDLQCSKVFFFFVLLNKKDFAYEEKKNDTSAENSRSLQITCTKKSAWAWDEVKMQQSETQDRNYVFLYIRGKRIQE